MPPLLHHDLIDPAHGLRGPRWLRAIVLLWLVSLALPVDAGDFDPAEDPWGFGYDGGLTLRRKLGGKWEVGVSGGPNDWLGTRVEDDFDRNYEPPGSEQTRHYDSETRREGGFVAVHVGRSVWQRGSFDMICYLRASHNWSNRSEYYETTREGSSYGNPRSWTRSDEDERDYGLSLGFRPAYRPVPWFSIEVGFGLAYYWTSDYDRSEQVRYDEDGYREESVWIDQDDGQSFRVFGYSGLYDR